jgi:hypothetical protein
MIFKWAVKHIQVQVKRFDVVSTAKGVALVSVVNSFI